MPVRKYGAAYQGSKSKIADEIISFLPARKYFIDVFAGGGALAHCALESGKFEHIIANDLQTKEILEAHFLWTPEQHLEFQKRWITREEFEHTNNLYIKTCWSFSNNRKAYIYSKACYEYKRRLHNAICFGNYREFEDYCGIDLSEIDSYEDLNERRKAARRAILKALKPYSFKETINSNTHIPKEIYDAILAGNKNWRNLAGKKDWRNLAGNKCIDRILRAETLETSKNVESLAQQENILRSKNITAKNISITSKSYDEIDLPDPAETVIICDPPYRNTQGYQVEFDNDKFEQWCIDKSRAGYEVFVCEYNIENPAFEEVWEKEVINTGGGNKNQKRSVEKLYQAR